jgi:sigma-70-like protein
MSTLDELPPDQRAALSLLLGRRKRYGEVALLLGIPERAVHDRAHAALAMLAPRQARALTAAQREEIGDYLLDQQAGVAEQLRTRTLLETSQPARAWAQALAGELAGLAAGALPEIPAAAGPGAGRPARAAQPAGAGAGSAAGGSPLPVGSPAADQAPPSSRRGGALLLAGIVVAVVVAVILITSNGGGNAKTSSSTTSSTAASKAGPTISAQLPLHSPSPGSTTVGVVAVLSEKGKHAFYIEAQHLPATHNFYYAIWLYNSPTSAQALSKSPSVGSTHKLAGGSTLPANAGEYREILLTRETSGHPTHPGPVVLRGAFSLGS